MTSPSPAATPENLEALKRAIYSGHKRVEYDAAIVEYQSTAAMIRACDLLEADLAGKPPELWTVVRTQTGL